MNLPPETCPCGSDIYIESLQTGGWQKSHINHAGEAEYTDLDGLRYKRPKTVRCPDCGRRYLNPNHEDNDDG